MPQHLNSIGAVCVVLFLWVSIILYSRLVQRILIPRCDEPFSQMSPASYRCTQGVLDALAVAIMATES